MKPIIYCPHCGKRADSHFVPGHLVVYPRLGDFSVCIFCAQVSVFIKGNGRKLLLRKTTPEDLELLPPIVLEQIRQARIVLDETVKKIHKAKSILLHSKFKPKSNLSNKIVKT